MGETVSVCPQCKGDLIRDNTTESPWWICTNCGKPFGKEEIKVCEDHPLGVLGESCMVVMPPSIVDGKKYGTISSWRVDLEPDDNLLDSMVRWWRKLTLIFASIHRGE